MTKDEHVMAFAGSNSPVVFLLTTDSATRFVVPSRVD